MWLATELMVCHTEKKHYKYLNTEVTYGSWLGL